MASGREHDQSTKLWCLPFGLITGIILGFQNGILAGISFVLGGLWLSADLDICSKPLKRWGILQIIWWPYRKTIPHRSILSHGPLIGSSIRLIYLLGMIFIAELLIQAFGFNLEIISLERILKLIEDYREETISILLGIEGSLWLHLIKDKDPLPIKLNKRKRK